jgi:hypothetical protein
VTDPTAAEMFDLEPQPFAEAVREALREQNDET